MTLIIHNYCRFQSLVSSTSDKVIVKIFDSEVKVK